MRKKNGFSLIEALVALAVMGIGGYFIMSMVKTGSIGQKTLLAQDDARQLTDNIATMLTDPWACQYTFGDGNPQPINGISPPGGALSPAVSANPVSGALGGATAIQNVYDRNKSVQFAANLPPYAGPFQRFGNGGLELYSITIGGTLKDGKTGIQRWVSQGTTSGTAFVQVDWLQTGGKGASNGPQHLIRYFLVNATKIDAQNRIVTCTAQGSAGSAAPVATVTENTKQLTMNDMAAYFTGHSCPAGGDCNVQDLNTYVIPISATTFDQYINVTTIGIWDVTACAGGCDCAITISVIPSGQAAYTCGVNSSRGNGGPYNSVASATANCIVKVPANLTAQIEFTFDGRGGQKLNPNPATYSYGNFTNTPVVSFFSIH